MAALVTAPTAWAGHVRIVVGEPPAGGAQGLLIAGRGKEVSGSDAARVLAKVPKGACPCPVTIYVTLPREPVHNVRRYRIAIVGDGYHGLLVSSRTKVSGLVSLYDLEPTVKALDRGEKPPLTARPDSNPQETLRRLDLRLAEAHDSRGPASYVVFGLGALFALLAFGLRSSFWGRAALLASPVALIAALGLSAFEIARPRSVGLSLLAVVGLGAPALAALTRSRFPLAAALLAVFAAYAGVLAFATETSSLAAFGPHPDGGVRFYGVSNQVETLLIVPGLLGGALLGVGLLPLIAVCVLVVVGASGLGADGGGVLVFAAGYLFLWLRLRRVALTARNVALAGATAIGVGLLLVGLDAAFGGSSHVTRTVGDGPGALAGELAHRWRVSLDGYVSSGQATLIITFSLLLLVWIALRRPRYAAVDAVLVALAVSLLVNDSPRDVAAYGALSCAALRFWEEARRVQ
ncbi:MAG: hypothetical protein E6G31_08150 [Actinobacteria bacterium]|nr:MAG: hypothetical protein E6G31_08150 [Actinomycetota bacterium]